LYLDEDEDRQTYGKLFNRDVLALIMRYVMSYRRHLFIALVFVLFIAGSNLLVPFLLRTLIDRHISKQGVILALPGGATAGQLGKALEEQVIRIAKQAGIRVIGPNCLGFTKMLTTVILFSSLDLLTRLRWPSWSAPIVGTNPMVLTLII